MVEAYFPIFFCLFLHPQNRQIEFGCLILEDLAQSTIFDFFFAHTLLSKQAETRAFKKSNDMKIKEIVHYACDRS